jgi:hypothetical protein
MVRTVIIYLSQRNKRLDLIIVCRLNWNGGVLGGQKKRCHVSKEVGGSRLGSDLYRYACRHHARQGEFGKEGERT